MPSTSIDWPSADPVGNSSVASVEPITTTLDASVTSAFVKASPVPIFAVVTVK